MIQRCQDLIIKTNDLKLKAVLQFLIEDEKTQEKLLIDVVKQVSALDREITP